MIVCHIFVAGVIRAGLVTVTGQNIAFDGEVEVAQDFGPAEVNFGVSVDG